MVEHLLSRLNFSPHENTLTSNSFVASCLSHAPSMSVEELYIASRGRLLTSDFFLVTLPVRPFTPRLCPELAREPGNTVFVCVEHELWLELAANDISLKAPFLWSERHTQEDVACFLP